MKWVNVGVHGKHVYPVYRFIKQHYPNLAFEIECDDVFIELDDLFNNIVGTIEISLENKYNILMRLDD